MKENRKKFPMPKIEPIQFPTEGLGLFKRGWRWITYTRKWRVVEDYYFTLPGGNKIMIPAGFIFDGASIPKLFRGLLSPCGILFIAAIFHDYAYQHDKLIGVSIERCKFSYQPAAGRKFWDDLFLQIANRTNGLTKVNKIAYYVLRVGGWLSWNKYRKEEKIKQ